MTHNTIQQLATTGDKAARLSILAQMEAEMRAYVPRGDRDKLSQNRYLAAIQDARAGVQRSSRAEIADAVKRMRAEVSDTPLFLHEW